MVTSNFLNERMREIVEWKIFTHSFPAGINRGACQPLANHIRSRWEAELVVIALFSVYGEL